MLIDCFCSQPGYASHLVPVWEAIPLENRGTFTAPGWFAHRLPFPTVSSVPRHGDVILAAAVRDFAKDRHTFRVHLEHGVGQTYGDRHPAYPGGAKRGFVDLFLCPSQRVAELEGPKAVVVGAPKLDWYTGNQEPPGSDDAADQPGRVVAPGHNRYHQTEGLMEGPENVTEGTAIAAPAPNGSVVRGCERLDVPTVALTWHWDASGISPEAGTAWWEYKPELHALKEQGWEILGHAHPRIEQSTTPHYEKAGIEVITDFGEIIDRADVLCLDNSSAGPEFAAATGRPLVWVNASSYRRGVDHGQRFWGWVEGQIQCDHPSELVSAIEFAMDDRPPIRAARQDMIEDAYAMLDGKAAERCVEAILNLGD